MKNIKYKLPLLITGILLDSLLIYLCLTPHPPRVDFKFFPLDKAFHFLVYLALTSWFIQLLKKKYYVTTVIFFLFQGILIEILQKLSGNRSFEIADIMANSLGAGLSYYIFKKYDEILLGFLIENKP